MSIFDYNFKSLSKIILKEFFLKKKLTNFLDSFFNFSYFF